MLKLALIVLVRHEQGVVLEARFIVNLSSIAGGFMSGNRQAIQFDIYLMEETVYKGLAVHLGRSGVENSDGLVQFLNHPIQ